MGLFNRKKYTINDINVNISRSELVQRSRILFIDDEEPELITDLIKAGFSVDHEIDLTIENCHLIDHKKYDLILLDYGNVGSKFGEEEGLSLLKHIKRVNPAVVVISYTSKALPAKQADFFILTDGTLPKDAGIADSMEKIENGLMKAHSIERNWKTLIKILGIKEGSESDQKAQNDFVKSLKNDKKREIFKKSILTTVSADESGIVNEIVLKLFGLGIKAAIAAI